MTDKEDAAFVERFTVRMPDGMRDLVAARAKANGRSMNSEIIQIIQDALDASSGTVRTGNTDTDRELQSLLVSLRRHAQEQDMLLNDFVHILNKKPT